MLGAQLRKIHKAKPFRPFSLHLADGQTIPVVHPECLMLSQDGRIAAVMSSAGLVDVIDVPLVTEIRYRRGAKRA